MNILLYKKLINHKFSRKSQSVLALLTTLLFFAASSQSSAQYFKRIYANSAPSGDVSHTPFIAGVDDREDALATAGEVQSASTLSVAIGAFGLVEAEQNIRFTGDDLPTAGTPVTLKIETGASLAGIANSVEIEATQNGTRVSKVITNTELLGLLGGGVLSGGKNVYEVTFVPKNASNANVAYNGVRLRVTTLAGVAVTAKLFHAFYLKPVTSPVACDAPIDALYGVDGSIATLGAGSTNPYTLVTGTGGTTQLNTGITAGGNVSETVLFSGAGEGDVEIIVSIPPTLISLTLLSNITVKAMNGTTVVGNESLGSLLGVDLLGLFQSGNPITLRFPTTGAFDRVSIATGGVVSALSHLKIHSIKRVLPKPTVATANYTIYAGQSATLQATSLNTTDVLTWYNNANTVIGTGTSVVVTPPATTTYKVEATLSATCTYQSTQATATVTVLPLPAFTNPKYVIETTAYTPGSGIAVTATGVGTNYGFSNPIGLPAGLTLNANGTITGTPAVGTGTGVPVTFTANVNDASNGNIPVVVAKSFTITVYPKLTLTGGPFPEVNAGAASYSNPLSVVTSSITLGGKGPSFYIYSSTLPSLRTATAGLPAGFVLLPTGALVSSLPVASSIVGEYTFDIYVTDGLQIAVAPFTLKINPNPLPVTLTSFKVAKEGQTAVLKWATTAETNSDYFEIQRSDNGKVWNKIGVEKATGESKQLSSYNFVDAKPLNGSNLYRLKMTDADGTFAYSSINSAEFNFKSVELFPNPTVDLLNLRSGEVSKVARLQISAVSGKVVYDQAAGNNSGIDSAVNMKNFPSGIYLVRLTKVDGTVEVHKIVKQ